MTSICPLSRPWIQRALLTALVAVLLMTAKDRAYPPTFRLFLEQREAAARPASGQQSGIEDDRVVPTVVTRGADRVTCATEIWQNSANHVGTRPVAPFLSTKPS